MHDCDVSFERLADAVDDSNQIFSGRRWITRWKAALDAFAITFEGRLTPATR